MTADQAGSTRAAAGVTQNLAASATAPILPNLMANSVESSSSIQTQLVQELNQKLIESSNQCNSLKVENTLALKQLKEA